MTDIVVFGAGAIADVATVYLERYSKGSNGSTLDPCGCLPDMGTLEASRYGWRRWYESGLHEMAHFSACPQDDMIVAGDLSDRLIGLPMAPDLGDDEIARIVHVLASACDADSGWGRVPSLKRAVG